MNDGRDADCSAGTTTTAGKTLLQQTALFRLNMMWGKNNRISLRTSKQAFFFQSEPSCDPKSPFLSFSLHFLRPTSRPTQGHVHPVACRLCFFPFRFFFFFLHLLKLSTNSPSSSSSPRQEKATFVTAASRGQQITNDTWLIFPLRDQSSIVVLYV